MDGILNPIRRALRNWWAEHQKPSSKDLAQRSESSLDLRKGWPHHKKTMIAEDPNHHGSCRNSIPRKMQSMNFRKKVTAAWKLEAFALDVIEKKATAKRRPLQNVLVRSLLSARGRYVNKRYHCRSRVRRFRYRRHHINVFGSTLSRVHELMARNIEMQSNNSPGKTCTDPKLNFQDGSTSKRRH